VRVRIKDTVYDITDVVETSTLGTLKKMKALGGESVKTISTAFEWAAEQSKGETFTTLDLLDNPAFLGAMCAIIYLAKHQAGENITWDEAEGFAFPDFEIIPDEEEPDPKAEGDVPPEPVDESSNPLTT